MAEEVLQVLLGRVPLSSAATLEGFTRFSINGRRYPIINKSLTPGTVKGRLLYGINPTELEFLDMFEGQDYTRTAIIAQTEDGKHVNAGTYVVSQGAYEQLQPLLSSEWDYQHFREKHLESFVKACIGFKNDGTFYD